MNLLARHVIFRALLRWTAAVAFCIPLKHRPHARLRALGMLLPLLGLTYVLDPAAQSTSLHELQFSLLTLYVAFFVLLGMMIYACVEIDKKSALYCAVWSLLASQTAYECWHLVEVFFEWRGTPLDLRSLTSIRGHKGIFPKTVQHMIICTSHLWPGIFGQDIIIRTGSHQQFPPGSIEGMQGILRVCLIQIRSSIF